MQQDHIGEHLDGPIRDVVIEKRVFERSIRVPNQQTAIRAYLSLDVTNARDPLTHFFQHSLKTRLFFMQAKGHRGQIVPGTG